MNSPSKDPAAILPKRIKRAVAEQAVEVPFGLTMTRIKHAIFITEKFMTMLHRNLHLAETRYDLIAGSWPAN